MPQGHQGPHPDQDRQTRARPGRGGEGRVEGGADRGHERLSGGPGRPLREGDASAHTVGGGLHQGCGQIRRGPGDHLVPIDRGRHGADRGDPEGRPRLVGGLSQSGSTNWWGRAPSPIRRPGG
ncbi:hypothetical protein B005_0093 [Nocardiopsis alba ATCC BAA-2165]|uniref:Uncharacterized protein n=1 Tax=Nocardiopsis alba (strain ATCC BAA-2165 / BE74) TaxID=1205910 RepID=J7LGM8_NOCAA|nr:hypothetical protein B005_0093 [Nocardiopsis alba ATCC BAA-2165]